MTSTFVCDSWVHLTDLGQLNTTAVRMKSPGLHHRRRTAAHSRKQESQRDCHLHCTLLTLIVSQPLQGKEWGNEALALTCVQTRDGQYGLEFVSWSFLAFIEITIIVTTTTNITHIHAIFLDYKSIYVGTDEVILLLSQVWHTKFTTWRQKKKNTESMPC